MNKEIKFIEQIVASLEQQQKELENKIYILNDKFNNPAWISDKNYLNYEIGQAKIKLSHVEYIIKILNIRLEKMKLKQKNVVEQFTFKP